VAKTHAKFDVPKEMSNKILQALEVVKNSGKVRKGINETTKAVERGIAQLVVIAGDVEPAEIVMHLPVLCEEKNIPYVFVPSKQELGRAIGIDVACAAVGVVEAGEAKDALKEILRKIEELKKE
jgi:large subunit ribosomal protein L7Ae